MNQPNQNREEALPPSPARADDAQEDAQRKLHDLLEAMWEQSKETVIARLNVLEEAVRNLHDSPTLSSRETGIDAAHKLAGILGTFGLPQGTVLAREIEVAMSIDGPLAAAETAHLQQVVGELAKLVALRTLPTAR